MGAWHDLDVGRPIAAPLERCAELLSVDLATVYKLAAKVEPYLRASHGGRCAGAGRRRWLAAHPLSSQPSRSESTGSGDRADGDGSACRQRTGGPTQQRAS